MDFTSIRRRKVVNSPENNLSDLYPLNVQMYPLPPNGEITLSEFEDMALDRLQVLRILEQATHKGHKVFSEDWKNCIKQDLIKEDLKPYLRLMGWLKKTEPDYEARRADHISHFILRLAYCRSDDLRRWFLARELDLFKLRFQMLNEQEVFKFLEINNLTYVPISNDEKEKVRNDLIESTIGLSDVSVDTTNFYKVPFVEVGSLIKARKVFLKNGFAYIPSTELVVCILSVFRAQLNEALAYNNSRLPSLDDERLNYLLKNLHNSYTGKDYTEPTDKNQINIADLDLYSRRHHPLCMRHIHEVLRSTHEMKHDCRLQYGLFIKAIGVTFDDAMTFWRDEFTKKLSEDQFEKKYAYFIKHQYGKVGRLVSYSPYSCIKIIQNTVGPGLHHGCPYKHWDSSALKQKLTEIGISNDVVQEILELSKNGHYQVACGKYFDYTHGQPSGIVINHPNQYFEESIKLSKNNLSNSVAPDLKDIFKND